MPHTFVIFGASGDLTSRKLIPALFQLHREQRLPPDTRVVGLARTDFSDEQWRASLETSTKAYLGESFAAGDWLHSAVLCTMCSWTIGESDDFQRLAVHLRKLEQGEHSTRVYYLSTAPSLYSRAIAQLGRQACPMNPLALGVSS